MHGCEGHPVCGWWLRFQECKRLLSTCHWRAPVVMVWRVSVGLPGGCFCFGWVVGLGLAGFCGPLGRVPLLRVGGWPRVGCGGCGDAVSHFHCFSCLKRAKMNPSPDPADPADPPDPADPVHGLPPGTSPTRAGGQDDGSLTNSLKLLCVGSSPRSNLPVDTVTAVLPAQLRTLSITAQHLQFAHLLLRASLGFPVHGFNRTG